MTTFPLWIKPILASFAMTTIPPSVSLDRLIARRSIWNLASIPQVVVTNGMVIAKLQSVRGNFVGVFNFRVTKATAIAIETAVPADSSELSINIRLQSSDPHDRRVLGGKAELCPTLGDIRLNQWIAKFNDFGDIFVSERI